MTPLAPSVFAAPSRVRGLAALAVAALVLTAALLVGSGRAEAREPDLAAEWNGAEIAWRTLPVGIKEATASGKTAIMVFHASWCTACRQYRTVFRDPGVVEAARDYVMILIDVDKDPRANGAFAPDGTYVPRTLFMTPEGDVRTDLVGKTDPEHPHTIDIKDPTELLSLMRRGAGRMPKGPDERAALD